MEIESERAERMTRRVAAAAVRAGLDRAGVPGLSELLAAVLRHRLAGLGDEDHPEFLHPARVCLILLEDLGRAEPELIEAAILLESADPALQPPGSALARAHPPARDLLESVPRPLGGEDERLLEELVSLDLDARLLALAERLDHARHLHLRPPAEWERGHRLACRAYAPVAERTDPTLARRYRWWCDTFASRFLPSAS